jgi:hypothetical protein
MRLGWASVWGIGGTAALLVEAIVRLLPLGLEPLRSGQLSASQGALYFVVVLFFGFAEGYRGFQRAFSPRAAARAVWLDHHGTVLQRALAPLFCMALISATRRRLIVNWALVFGIVALIVLVRQLPPPYRGMIDGGVVVGLSWGTLATLLLFARAARGDGDAFGLELDERSAARAAASPH